MPLTRDFIETIKARADQNPAFRIKMLENAVECLIGDEPEVGRILLRDYVKATFGLEELARRAGMSSPSVKRMLSKEGNPTLNNLAAIIGICQKQEGIVLGVTTLDKPKRAKTLEKA